MGNGSNASKSILPMVMATIEAFFRKEEVYGENRSFLFRGFLLPLAHELV
jgi:hypothetical protein